MNNFMNGALAAVVLIGVFSLGLLLGFKAQKEGMCSHIKHELKVESRLCKDEK